MSIESVCAVCESAVAVHSCPLCGSPVCRDHYDSERGVCGPCSGGVTGDGHGVR